MLESLGRHSKIARQLRELKVEKAALIKFKLAL